MFQMPFLINANNLKCISILLKLVVSTQVMLSRATIKMHSYILGKLTFFYHLNTKIPNYWIGPLLKCSSICSRIHFLFHFQICKRFGDANIGVDRNKSIKYNLSSLIAPVRGLGLKVIQLAFLCWKSYDKWQTLV